MSAGGRHKSMRMLDTLPDTYDTQTTS